MKKIILIVGMPGSGKSLAADIIKKNFKAGAFHSGDIIRDEIKRRKLRYTPETDNKIADWFHAHGREKLLIRRLWNKIKKSNRKLIVIEGLRSKKQLGYLKKHHKKKIIVISIKASLNVRVKRELKRKRFGKQESIEYLKFREKMERKRGVLGIIKKADYTVHNTNVTKRQFEKKIVKLIEKLLK